MDKPRIVFMGTPDFAVPSLRAMVEAGYPVIAVFTQPDRPSGRGHKLAACPVKQYALEQEIPVYQFERVRRSEGLEAMRDLAPDLIVTAAFGQILPQKLLDIPKFGTINVHASLLPKYRGAAPINWCLIHGEEKSGVTTMRTDAGIDTGDMLLCKEIDILPEETAGELTVRLAEVGADVLLCTLEALAEGALRPIKQDESQMSHQPMLKKEMGRVDFAQDAQRIANLVRGVTPWPGAYATLPDGGTLKILVARSCECEASGEVGEVIVSSAKAGLVVRCEGGAVELIEIQAPGSRRMAAKAYLMGKQIAVGTKLNAVPSGYA